MLSDQVLVEDLAHLLAKLVEQHHMGQLHLQVKPLHKEGHVIEVDHIGEVSLDSHLQYKHILWHYDVIVCIVAILCRLLLLYDRAKVCWFQDDRVDGIHLALIVNLDAHQAEIKVGYLLRLLDFRTDSFQVQGHELFARRAD